MTTNPESQTPRPKSHKHSARGIWKLGVGSWELLALALVIAGASVSSGCSYNTFVSKEEGIKAQWAQVENQLQRRNDLIPNLVETTKGFAQHEEGIYKDIADARSRLLVARKPAEAIADTNQPTADLGRQPAVRETNLQR